MKKGMKTILWIAKIILGCALFSAGFAFFLEPNHVNAGGITGLAMSVVHLLGFGTVGPLTLLINLPLFIVSGIKIGKKFFVGSLVGLLISSVMLDAFALLPHPEIEPLVAGLYGGFEGFQILSFIIIVGQCIEILVLQHMSDTGLSVELLDDTLL